MSTILDYKNTICKKCSNTVVLDEWFLYFKVCRKCKNCIHCGKIEVSCCISCRICNNKLCCKYAGCNICKRDLASFKSLLI